MEPKEALPLNNNKMKLKSIFLAVILTLCGTLAASAKVYCTPIYIFGLSASFNDSVVYITNVQVVDSAWLDEKTDFLISRNEYSSQLKNYFTSKGQPNRTCIVSFAEKEKDILKKYAKMKERYMPNKKKVKNFDLRTLDEDDFQFTAVKPYITDETEIVEKKNTSKKAEKAKRRKEEGKLDQSPKSSAQESEMPSMPPRH